MINPFWDLPLRSLLLVLGLSGFLREMLENSTASINDQEPLHLDENSQNFEILLAVIAGQAPEVLQRVIDWKHSVHLLQLADKYQLDGHRPWFSKMCRIRPSSDAWYPLLLACHQSPIDTDIIHTAISFWFPLHPLEAICNPDCFTKMEQTSDGSNSWSTLRPANISATFGLKLGLRGLLAYNFTFAGICQLRESKIVWSYWAKKFFSSVNAVESARGTSVSTRNRVEFQSS